MGWSWRYEGADGERHTGPGDSFPSQSDAESWLGQDPDDPSRYRVFRSRAELADAGFRPWRGPLVLGDWSDYRPHARA